MVKYIEYIGVSVAWMVRCLQSDSDRSIGVNCFVCKSLFRSGSVAQWKSVPFTSGRSKVRSLPEPLYYHAGGGTCLHLGYLSAFYRIN